MTIPGRRWWVGVVLFSVALGAGTASAGSAEEVAAPEAKASKEEGPRDMAEGFKVADTQYGDLNLRVFTYARYLNHRALDGEYTDVTGQTVTVQRRQDFQLNKAQITAFGWILSENFRYVAYAWSANATQGLGAQVVVAGNLTYRFADYLTVGAGITSLPGSRTTDGTFPRWLSVDSRLMGEEFFRPSYTTGIWASGKIIPGLRYAVMLANNLSQLGVDAGQMDNLLNTVSGELVLTPTTQEFGKGDGYGDFEHHERLATRVALHYTYSREDRQSQPGTEAFENSQIRLSEGSVIFKPNLFGPGIQIDSLDYQLAVLDGGVKLRGFSLEGEYYVRKVSGFSGAGVEGLSFTSMWDHGFTLQASAMLWPKTLQLYAGGTKVFGTYGDPWDLRVGLSWFPWETQIARLTVEYLQLWHSPAGGLSYAYPVGATGPAFSSSLVLYF